MGELTAGQVLWLIFRFNNDGGVSNHEHPYVVVDIEEKIVEVIQLDSLKDGNRLWAFSKHGKVIHCDNPNETVIYKDSYAQLNNKFTIDNFPGLLKYRRTKDFLSTDKFSSLLKTYQNYQKNNIIDENKIVHMTEDEIKELNK